MITEDTKKRIAEIYCELSRLEIYIEDCCKSLDKLSRAKTEDALPNFLLDPEEYTAVMFITEEFIDEVNRIYFDMKKPN